MISKTQIRYMANSSSYSKGAELYATGKVLDMDVKIWVRLMKLLHL